MILQFIQSFPLLTLILILVVYVLSKFRRDKRIKRLVKNFPGPPSYPFIGCALEFNIPNDALVKLVLRHVKLYGERYVIAMGIKFFMVLRSPKDLEKVFNSSIHIDKGFIYTVITPWLGDGLLTSTGKKWQRRRKMLTPSFHFKIVEDFLPIFNEHSSTLIEILNRDFANRTEKDICPYLTNCTLDIIGETAMDIQFNSQRDPTTPYVKAVYKACELMVQRALRPWLWPSLVFYLSPTGRKMRSTIKVLHDFTDKVIRERKAAGPIAKASDSDEGFYGKRRRAFLDTLLDAQKNPENELSDLDIREEVDTFMFEGHDTTAASLMWTVFLLGSHQQYQAKVHEELDRIFGDDRTRPATIADLAEIKYLDMCIKEALRLFPSVPFVSRNLKSDIVLDDETIIPAGVNIVIMPMQVHRQEKIYPEPATFLPDRFLPENIQGRHPFAYIPFSAGPRNCIGQKFATMEEKVILSHLFRNFKVEAAEPLEDVVLMMDVITRPRDGLKVRLVPR